MDKTDEKQKRAYDMIKPVIEQRFSEEECEKLRGAYRTQNNEV